MKKSIQQKFISAIISGKNTELPSLLKQGANPNAQDLSGWTPLHFAALHANQSAVEFLLKNGAQVNAINQEDQTPLDLIIDKEYGDAIDISTALLAEGAYALQSHVSASYQAQVNIEDAHESLEKMADFLIQLNEQQRETRYSAEI